MSGSDPTEVNVHGKDKGGEKHVKRAAQKNLKQKRAEKKAKRQSAQAPTVHITTTQQ
jgi:hypothetical protein